MAIGTTAALLGSAAISAGASYLGGKSQKKAASKAADISQQNSRENNALTREIYGQNTANFQPYLRTGQVANNAIMELLGLAQPGAAPATSQPSAFAPAAQQAPQQAATMPADFWPWDDRVNYGRTAQEVWDERQMMPQAMTNAQYGQPQAAGMVTTPAPSARSAFDAYRGSTGYDFRVNEGMNALQKAFGRNLESGAATKSALRFGQGIASDEFGKYMQLLGQQQQMGFGGASALAGVGQNMVNNVTANNNSAATAAANARLYAGNANANMWGNIGSSFGQVLGSMGGGGFGTIRF